MAERLARTPDDELPISFWVTVAREDASTTRAVLRELGARVRRLPAGSDVTFVVANPDGLSLEEHAFAGRIPDALRDRGVEVVGFRGPR